MAFDERLAERVRGVIADETGVSEKRMFGGLTFLLNGNMCCGLTGTDLMVRVGPDAYQEALARPHAREMDFTGKALKGFVFVAPAGTTSDADLRAWVRLGREYARSLPAK